MLKFMLRFDGFYSAFLPQPYFGSDAQSFWLWRFFENGTVIKFYYWGHEVIALKKRGKLDAFIVESINSLYLSTPGEPSSWQQGTYKYSTISTMDVITYYKCSWAPIHDHRYYVQIGYDEIIMRYEIEQKAWSEQFFNNQSQIFRFYEHKF
jgi:hypothetical protein